MLPTKLAFVDIETTGGRTSNDRIIEIGIVRFEEGEITKTFSSLINPQTHLPPEITRLTGITEQELQSAPAFREVAPDIEEHLADCVFVAHNVRFDYGFLKTEFKRLEQTFSQKHFCTVRLSRALFPNERHHNLDSIIQRFNLSVTNRHRALDDALAITTFYTLVQRMTPEDRFAEAMKTVLKKPYLPVKLSSEILENLPESPGVYVFYGQPLSDTVSVSSENHTPQQIPLYIGKSINIKERVLSHFSGDIHSPLEMKIAQQIQSIETFTTTGELGALFLESQLIKTMLPLFNRKLRRKRELLAIKKKENTEGYFEILLEPFSEEHISDFSSFLGFFNSRKQAKDHLSALAKEYQLCEKLLGLEKTTTSCFAYRLERCKGACTKKENPLPYNLRFEEAFNKTRIRPWPFQGKILIEESNPLEDTTDYFLVDQWCILEKTTSDTYGSSKTDTLQPHFDLDTYKILKQFLFSPKNASRIKILTATTDTEVKGSYLYQD